MEKEVVSKRTGKKVTTIIDFIKTDGNYDRVDDYGEVKHGVVAKRIIIPELNMVKVYFALEGMEECKTVGVSTCNTNDEFDLNVGTSVALRRALLSWAGVRTREFDEWLEW